MTMENTIKEFFFISTSDSPASYFTCLEFREKSKFDIQLNESQSISGEIREVHFLCDEMDFNISLKHFFH